MQKNKINIACIYNMNNNMFTIARFLRNYGYNVDVLLMNEDEHFLPASDTFNDPLLNNVVYTNWIDKKEWMSLVKKEDVTNITNKYNFFIGCGYTPAFFEWVGKKLDIFIPYGSDLYLAPFEEIKVFDKNKFDETYPQFQFKGIQNARHVVFDYTTEQEPVFKKFNLKGKRHYFFPPVFYNKEFNDTEIKKYYSDSELYKTLKTIREENEYIIIQHSRQSWKSPQDEFSNKRNDILIYAFKKFTEESPNCKTVLILFEYGIDVEATKQLIAELNLTSRIHWLPKSNRKEVMIALSIADIGIAELGMSFLMYGTVGEFMTMNLPFILNCRSKDFENSYPELYPVNHADSVETCFFHINECYKNKKDYQLRANLSKKWFDKYIIEIPVKKLIAIIESETNKNWLQKLFN